MKIMRHFLIFLLACGTLPGTAVPQVAFIFGVSNYIDRARTAGAGEDLIAASFKITVGAGGSVTTIEVKNTGATTIPSTCIERLAVYEDINANGCLDPGTDELVVEETVSPALWITQGIQSLTLPSPLSLPSHSDPRFFLVVMNTVSHEPNAGDLDNKTIDVTVGINGGYLTEMGRNDTVLIEATHLKWLPDGLDLTVAKTGNAALDGRTVLAAVDDYGNRDTDYGGGG